MSWAFSQFPDAGYQEGTEMVGWPVEVVSVPPYCGTSGRVCATADAPAARIRADKTDAVPT